MKIKFWGVRGSIPTPGKTFTKFGGNTSCVELHVNNKVIIFDMGSGLVNLGNYLMKKILINLIFYYHIFIMIILAVCHFFSLHLIKTVNLQLDLA